MRGTRTLILLLAWSCLGWADAVDIPEASAARLPTAAPIGPPGPVGSGRLALPEEVSLPELDDSALDRMRAQFGPSWLGPTRPVPEDIEGTWTWTQTGDRVWRVTIRATGARALRVRFEGFRAEGLVWLYGDEWNGPHIGPYDGPGPHGDRDFWSEFVFGEAVTIEYVPRNTAGASDRIPFRIRSIAHIAAERFPVPGTPGKPIGSIRPRSLAGCHLDVSCYPALERRDRPSVARLFIQRDGGTSNCTGFLINPKYGSDSFLLLLTAGHCVSTQEEAEDISFLWNYQTEKCYGNPNVTEWEEPLAISYGAQLIVARDDDEDGDFALLALDRAAVESVTGWRARGWSSRDLPTGEQVMAVSHPDGSHKRAAFGDVVDRIWRDRSLETVQWRLGTTEPGSSGAPVFRFSDDFGYWIVAGVLIGDNESSVDAGSPWGSYCDADLRSAVDPLSHIYETIQPYMDHEDEVERILVGRSWQRGDASDIAGRGRVGGRPH